MEDNKICTMITLTNSKQEPEQRSQHIDKTETENIGSSTNTSEESHALDDGSNYRKL